MGSVELTTYLGGVRLRNPILPGASELAFDSLSAQRLIDAGVGAVVTKSFTSDKQARVRLRPYQFSLRRFGEAYASSGSFWSLSAPHVEDPETILRKNIPGIRRVCGAGRVPLVVSFYESFNEPEKWAAVARSFEQSGADLLELNFSSPSHKQMMEESPTVSADIAASVIESIGIPVGVKIGPSLEPLTKFIADWAKRGVAFITAHNAPSGIFIDVEREEPYGAPAIGGYLIGRPFLPWSLARVVQIKKTTAVDVVGVGGIHEWTDALQYMLCGCSAVQVCTSAYVHGLGVFSEIQEGISRWMDRKGYTSIEAFRGRVLPRILTAQDLKSQEEHPYTLPPESPYIPSVDSNRCSLCFDCGKGCIYRVFSVEGGRLRIDAEKCWSCGLCVGLCPQNALVLVDRKTGETVWDGAGMASAFRIHPGKSTKERRGGDGP